MPSSGYGMVNLRTEDPEDFIYIIESAKHAMKMNMFVEWLECFISAWNETKNPVIASNAGLIEWDM